MAIIIEKKSADINWFAISVVLFILVFFGIATYAVFFSETPLIETIAPTEPGAINELAQVSVDQNSILNNKVFSSSTNHIPEPETGTLGRPNPFAPF